MAHKLRHLLPRELVHPEAFHPHRVVPHGDRVRVDARRISHLTGMIPPGPDQHHDDVDEESKRLVAFVHLVRQAPAQRLVAATRLLRVCQRAVPAGKVRAAQVVEVRRLARLQKDKALGRAGVVRRGLLVVAGGADGRPEDGGHRRGPGADGLPEKRTARIAHLHRVFRPELVVLTAVDEGIQAARDEECQHEETEELDRLKVERQTLGVLADLYVVNRQGKRPAGARDGVVAAMGTG